MEFRTLLPWEFEAWFDHLAEVFNQYRDLDASRHYFMNHWYNDPWRDRHAIFVAMDDDTIASTLRVFHRKIYLQGAIYTQGGIGEVSTKVAYRRQGLSGKLLEMAIDYMQREKLVFSMLSTGTPRHYARYGWEEVPLYRKIAKVPAKQCGEAKLMDFENPEELRQIRVLYQEYSCQFNGSLVRDHDAYWTKWIRTEGNKGWIPDKTGRGWVLQDDGLITAYLNVSKFLSDHKLYVEDFACKGNSAQAFDRLIQHAVWSLGVEEAVAIFPGVIATELPVEWSTEHGLMVRVNCQECKENLVKSNVRALFHGNEALDYALSRLVMWRIDGF